MKYFTSQYTKFWVSAAGATITAILAVWDDDGITSDDWKYVAVTVLTAIGVISLPNTRTSARRSDGL